MDELQMAMCLALSIGGGHLGLLAAQKSNQVGMRIGISGNTAGFIIMMWIKYCLLERLSWHLTLWSLGFTIVGVFTGVFLVSLAAQAGVAGLVKDKTKPSTPGLGCDKA
jgi:predicted alpha/beta hydrolase